MTINNTVTTTLAFSRAQAAAAFAGHALAERETVARLLADERAAYSDLLNREGAFENALHHWLANDVLPSLRKFGGYVVDEAFRPTAASIVNDSTGILMLSILADISERGLAPVEEADAQIAHEEAETARAHKAADDALADLDI